MSTHKHIDRICLAVIIAVLVITLLFMGGEKLGIQKAGYSAEYAERIFDTSKVHTIDIVMDDWDSFIETCENEEYAACDLVIDGETYSNVGLRAKGNTSLSSVSRMDSDRYSFKVEFDQYDDTKTYYGLDKLSLNNIIQDNTYMKDYLCYQLMNQFGVSSPLCSYVYITVNGEDWGLYLAAEGVEDSFLQRNYGNDAGELYKPDSNDMGGGRGNGRDFAFDADDGAASGNADNLGDADGSSNKGDAAGEDGSAGKTEIPGSENAQPPESGNSDGRQPFQSGDPPEMPDGSMAGGGMPGGNMDMPGGSPDSAPGGAEMPDGDTAPGMPDSAAPDDSTSSESGAAPDGVAGKSAMGSADVKLQYIDDDPSSYANIFDNAKTDITEADQTRLIQALKALSEGSDIDSVVDAEQVIRYFVVHNFVCNGDSYTGSMIHNYYLYEKDGQLSMIPWDYNLAFGGFQSGSASSVINESIDDPVSGGQLSDRPMLAWIFADETYTELYHQYFSDFISQYCDSGQLEQMIEETAALIAPYVEKDPTKFCTYDEFETGIEALQKFCQLRGESVSLQLSGSDEEVDASELNLSDMGSMNSTMEGGKGGGEAGGLDSGKDLQNPPSDDAGGPDGRSSMEEPSGSAKPVENSGQNTSNTWMLLGISVSILLIGLVIAIRYRR